MKAAHEHPEGEAGVAAEKAHQKMERVKKSVEKRIAKERSVVFTTSPFIYMLLVMNPFSGRTREQLCLLKMPGTKQA